MKIKSNYVWFTSDTHYHHTNICRGISNWLTNPNADIESTRDFPDLETMDNAIVDGINDNVEAEDYLIHLGDWSFGGEDKIKEFRERINCKHVILIWGNHDHHIKRKKEFQKLFEHVSPQEELRITDSSKPTSTFLMNHYPIVSWDFASTQYMLHGHQHLKGEMRFQQKRRMDVGICGSPEFRPYHIDEIVKLLDNNVNKELIR